MLSLLICAFRHLTFLFLTMCAIATSAQTRMEPGDTLRPDGSQWVYHPLSSTETHCLREGSGPASVLIRDAQPNDPLADTSQLFIYMEGGGSCYSVATCNGTSTNPSPKNQNGYKAKDFKSDTKLSQYLYLRTQPLASDQDPNHPDLINPFLHMNMVMVPYCTGDSHTGRQIRTSPSGEAFYFIGDNNFNAHALPYIKHMYSQVTTIWLMGTSAGAGGAAVQYRKVRAAYPNAIVHLIEDSSPVVPPLEPQHWDDLTAWQSKLPGAADCAKPPETRPTGGVFAFSMNKARNKQSSVPVASSKTRGRSSTSVSTMQTTSTDDGDDAEYADPFAHPLPFPTTNATTSMSNQNITASDIEPDATRSKPAPGTCYYLQDTRLFNRNLGNDFRYGIISFDWDHVLNPYGNLVNPQNPQDDTVGFPRFYKEMSGYTAQLEALSNKTKHLYIDNRSFVPTTPGQSGFCGRHVVTNFNVQRLGQGSTSDHQIQDAHHAFIVSMTTNNPPWTSNGSGDVLNQCPQDISDGGGITQF